MTPAPARADVAAVILAGGKSSRLGGQVKALLEVEGRAIVDRVLDVLAPRVSALAISANDATPFQGRALPVIPDETPGQGPLAGLCAALRWCRRPYLLAVACDMPHLDGRVVDRILARRAPGVDVVAPVVAGQPEPLLALYARQVLPVVERRLLARERKAADLVTDESLRLVQVYEAELRDLDPALRCLTNVNTPADLQRLDPW